MKPQSTPPGLLFLSCLYRSDLHTEAEILQHLGPYNLAQTFIPRFNPLINYYEKEMGSPLSRFMVCSNELTPREALLKTKLESLEWEEKWTLEGKRMVNIDVGFLSAENFILATTKNYSHRVFLGKDIFADLTYEYRAGGFKTFPWTYPDYADEEKLDYFRQERARLLKLLSR